MCSTTCGYFDKTLGKILGLFNTGIPILVSCTPDGTKGLSQRFAISQRVGTNTMRIDRLSPDDHQLLRFLQELWTYQYTDEDMPFEQTLTELIYEWTAGIPRIIVGCFINAQRQALIMQKKKMDMDDLTLAFKNLSLDIKDTITAIHNNDHRYLSGKPDCRF